jgi:Transposase
MTTTSATRHVEYIVSCLYLAVELGSEEWKLTFATEREARPRVRRVSAGDGRRLMQEIADAKQWFGLTAATAVRSCDEAGRDGFWLHRYLLAQGIANVVVDSASIEVNRRQRRAKSDGLDGRKLASMLQRYHGGERDVWSVVRVPTVEQEDRRQLHRELRTLKKDRTRVTNRVKGLLAAQGIRLARATDVRAALPRLRLWESRRCRWDCARGWSGTASMPNFCTRRSGTSKASNARPWPRAGAPAWPRSGSWCACGRSESPEPGCTCTSFSAGGSSATARK